MVVQDENKEQTEDAMPPESDADVNVVVVEATPVVLFQTTLRQRITPYLPPPVVKAMHRLDPELEPYLGPEPSMTILSTLFLALLVWQVVQKVTGLWNHFLQGRAIQDVDDDDDFTHQQQQYQQPYDATIVFCGPTLAGKTSLFYHLLNNNNNNSNGSNGSGVVSVLSKTVSSIQPNIGFQQPLQSQMSNDATNNNSTMIWRYLDIPGHWGTKKMMEMAFYSKSKQQIFPNQVPERIVLVLDSTQPVTKAADYLYELLVFLSSTSLSNQNDIMICVACHKCKEPKAKNVRRIKLQLRNELERKFQYEQTNQSTTTTSTEINNNNHKLSITLNWDELLQTRVVFVPTSVDDPPVLEELQQYLNNGTVVSTSM